MLVPVGIAYAVASGLAGLMAVPTMGQAVSSYVRAHSVEWVDWEDRR